MRTCSMWFPVHFRFLAHSLTTFGRWGCGERWDHSHMMQILFFLLWSYQLLRCSWDRAICWMVEGRRERQQLTPPSEGTGSLPLSICRTEPRPSITGRVGGRTRACVTYASSPHHLTRHATTYRELPPRSNSTNLAALHTVFVATHQVSAVDETLCAGSGTLTRAVAVVTAPPTANGLCKHAIICKNRIFSGFWGGCAVGNA